jgi:hypothetical protein
MAAMFAAQEANEKARHSRPVFGIVTTGEQWQVITLHGTTMTFDKNVEKTDDLPHLLGTIANISAMPANGSLTRCRAAPGCLQATASRVRCLKEDCHEFAGH